MTGATLGFDQYDIHARLKPALLGVLPALLLVAVWLPAVWTIGGGLAALVVFCGTLRVLASYSRSRGQAVQARLEADNGRQSVAWLRHRDTNLLPETKARYHTTLRAAGLAIPTAIEESRDPAAADRAYSTANDWLRERTRGVRLVALENIEYGFRRNLRGLKPFSGAILLLTVVINLHALTSASDPTRWWAGACLLVCQVAAGGVWAIVVNDAFVEEAGRNYARRLLASCETLNGHQSLA